MLYLQLILYNSFEQISLYVGFCHLNTWNVFHRNYRRVYDCRSTHIQLYWDLTRCPYFVCYNITVIRHIHWMPYSNTSLDEMLRQTSTDYKHNITAHITVNLGRSLSSSRRITRDLTGYPCCIPGVSRRIYSVSHEDSRWVGADNMTTDHRTCTTHVGLGEMILCLRPSIEL